MNHNVAFIFPGQGSQSVGMGRELARMHPVAQETFQEADAALGFKLSRVCWEGPEDKLRLTEITQPAILTVAVAAFRVLRECRLPNPSLIPSQKGNSHNQRFLGSTAPVGLTT